MLGKYKFHYSLRGDNDKPVILLLHGFMGNSHVFDDLSTLLSDHFCSLTIDLPGHGQTKVKGGDKFYNMQNTAQALVELLDSLGIKQCFLMGYSMGGRLALYLTLHFPQYFSKIVLESSSPGLKTSEQRGKRVESDVKLAEELETGDFSLFLSKWYSNPLFDSLKKDSKFEQLLANRLENNPLELAKSLRNLSTGLQPCLWEKLKDQKKPTLLVVGELDQKFVAINSEVANLCKYAQLKIVRDCGHNIHVEDTALFADLVRNFLWSDEVCFLKRSVPCEK